MSKKKQKIDIWQMLKIYEQEYGNPKNQILASVKPKTEEETAKNKKNLKRSILVLDIVGTIIWGYTFIQLFLYNLDGQLVKFTSPEYSWVINYKFLLFFGSLVFVGVFFWRIATAVCTAYLLLLPIIFIVWKIPKLLYKSGEWLGVMAGVNIIGLIVKNFRYNIITKGLGLIAASVIFTSTNTLLLIFSSLLLSLILMFASYRTVRLTISPDWFLATQEKSISKVVDSGFLKAMKTINEDISSGRVTKLDSASYTALTTSISNALLVNRALYFWSYQLQRYRQTSISLFFNIATFIWLLFGGIIVFWLINLSIYKIDHMQFLPSDNISNIAMLVYSMSTLFFSEGAGISPSGDFSYFARIAAGLFGAVFLLSVLGNVLMTVRQSRNNQELEALVSTLKQKAQEEDEAFKSEFSISPMQGYEKLQRMEQGLYKYIGSMIASMPSDFFEREKDPN